MKNPILIFLCLSSAACMAQNVASSPAGAPNASATYAVKTNSVTFGAKVNTALIPAPRPSSEQDPKKTEKWLARFQNTLRSSEKANSAKPAQVIFDGDSITDYFRNAAKDIWSQYEAKYNAINFAVSGDATEQVLYRLQNGQAKGMHPKLIFLMIGHNNCMRNTPEQIHEGVAAIIKKYQEVCPDSLIILQATFPSKEPRSRYRTSIAALDKLLPDLAQKDRVIYVDFCDKFLSPDGTISKDVMPDGTHPAVKGYQIWAAAIQPILDHYVPSSQSSSVSH
jgi:beta-glucosidase